MQIFNNHVFVLFIFFAKQIGRTTGRVVYDNNVAACAAFQSRYSVRRLESVASLRLLFECYFYSIWTQNFLKGNMIWRLLSFFFVYYHSLLSQIPVPCKDLTFVVPSLWSLWWTFLSCTIRGTDIKYHIQFMHGSKKIKKKKKRLLTEYTVRGNWFGCAEASPLWKRLK